MKEWLIVLKPKKRKGIKPGGVIFAIYKAMNAQMAIDFFLAEHWLEYDRYYKPKAFVCMTGVLYTVKG